MEYNVTFFYSHTGPSQGVVGIPAMISNVESMTIKDLKDLWPEVAAGRHVDFPNKVLVHIEVKI